jgi:hypothetical protein
MPSLRGSASAQKKSCAPLSGRLQFPDESNIGHRGKRLNARKTPARAMRAATPTSLPLSCWGHIDCFHPGSPWPPKSAAGALLWLHAGGVGSMDQGLRFDGDDVNLAQSVVISPEWGVTSISVSTRSPSFGTDSLCRVCGTSFKSRLLGRDSKLPYPYGTSMIGSGMKDIRTTTGQGPTLTEGGY